MRMRRETLLGISLLAIMLLLAVFVGLSQAHPTYPPLTSLSSSPDGALALKTWVDESGYQVAQDISNQFAIPPGTELIFMLEPDSLIKQEIDILDAWVKAGGTLIAAGNGVGIGDLAQHYDLSLTYLNTVVDQAFVQAPLFTSPPLPGSAVLHADYGFEVNRQNTVTLVAAEAVPLVVLFGDGFGRVIFSSTSYPFSNAGLKENGNPALVLNLIAASHRGLVWFDDWHHGIRVGTQVIGPERWLRYTSAGHALLFIAVIIFLALLLQGRTFGRPVPLPQETKRRGPLEQLTAVANLSRRAGHRAAVLDRYRQQIKRHWGQRYRIDPALPDQEFTDLLGRYNLGLDVERLRTLLRRLSRRNVREADMVNLAAEASDWLEE